MKILHLVLYSDDKFYNEMLKATNNYYSNFTNIKTIYYRFNNNIKEDYLLSNNILHIKGIENKVPGILEKTIKAFEYFKKDFHNYDYIIRSNISTLIDFKKLIGLLALNKYDYGGFLFIRNAHPKSFVSGTCIILGIQTVNHLLENLDKLNFNIIDDVSLGIYINRIIKKYKFLKLNDYYYWSDYYLNRNTEINPPYKKLENIICFRNRSRNRQNDIIRINYIIDYLKKIDK